MVVGTKLFSRLLSLRFVRKGAVGLIELFRFSSRGLERRSWPEIVLIRHDLFQLGLIGLLGRRRVHGDWLFLILSLFVFDGLFLFLLMFEGLLELLLGHLRRLLEGADLLLQVLCFFLGLLSCSHICFGFAGLLVALAASKGLDNLRSGLVLIIFHLVNDAITLLHVLLNEVKAFAGLLLEALNTLIDLRAVFLELGQQLVLAVGDGVFFDKRVELVLHVHQLLVVGLNVGSSDLLLLSKHRFYVMSLVSISVLQGLLECVDLLGFLSRLDLLLMHKLSLLLGSFLFQLKLLSLSFQGALMLDLVEVSPGGLLLGLVAVEDALVVLSDDIGQARILHLMQDILNL